MPPAIRPLFALLLVASCAPRASTKPLTYAPRHGEQKAAETPPAVRAAMNDVAAKIRVEATNNDRAYPLLAELCDDIGARLSGSPELTKALAWAEARMREAGHDNVKTEPVMVPTWVRGAESLRMNTPTARSLPVLGLGGTVSTPKGGVTAELAVVSTETELATRADVRGKIVLIDRPLPPFDAEHNDSGYGQAYGSRVHGPSLAAKAGAVAVLVRSLTAHSLDTLHTGTLVYDEDAPRIPAGSVTAETAAHLHRLVERGTKVSLTLSLASEDKGLTPSGNVVGELRGRERPEEVVVISGHIDSWDVGQGAADDGAGVVIAMEALSVLRRLGLTPRRTVRAVLFTNEENGLAGAKAYAKTHEKEAHVAAVESDNGAAKVIRLGVATANDADMPAAMARLEPVLLLLRPLGVTGFEPGHAGSDVAPLVRTGTLGVGLVHDATHYFDVHHTTADTFDKIDRAELAQGVAAMATLAYALAELDLYREAEAASPAPGS